MPDDKEKQGDCKELVKRLKQEKKERERRLEEQKKKADAKFSEEAEKRRREENKAAERKQLEENRRRDEVEFRIRQRRENRVKSMQEMDERTKAIGSSRTRVQAELQQRFKEVQNRAGIHEAELENVKEQAALISKSQNKYEDILKAKRDELRRKRGALEITTSDEGAASQKNHVSYRSRVHQELRAEKHEIKTQQHREYQEKVERTNKVRNYSKNVRDMYMPAVKERHRSSNNAERKFIEMGQKSGLTAQRSEMQIAAEEQPYGAEVPQKNITMKRRSGTADGETPADIQSEEKRLKLSKHDR